VSQDILSPSTDESLVFRAVEMFRRRQLVAILASAAVMASAVSFAVCLPDLFRATAIVLVERPIPEAFVRPAVNGELDSRLHVIKQEILSRERLTDLITRFNLYPELRRQAPLEAVVDRMRRDIEFDLSGVPQHTGRTATIAFTLFALRWRETRVLELAQALRSPAARRIR